MAQLRIKEAATEKGFNQSSLARRADIAIPTVARLWNDPYAKATQETLERIATALGVRVADLLVEGDDEA